MIFSNYELFVTLRYLNSKRREKFVPFITLCSLLGIAISVMTLIVVIGVMSGFERDLKTKMMSMNAHITVEYSSTDGIPNYPVISEKIAKIKHVEASAPFIMGEALIRTRHGGKGVVLKGIDPELENSVSDLESYIQAGDYKIDGKQVLIGSELAQYFHLAHGDVLIINIPTRSATSFGLIPRELKCTVAGIFKSGLYDFDMNFVYMPLSTYQAFLGIETVSGINVRVDDFDKAFSLKTQIMQQLGFPYYARTWIERNQNLFRAIQTEKVVMFIILVVAIIIAAFNISSTLVMTVMEKTKDIGILKSLGASRTSVMKIFLFQGAIVGVIGTILGVFLGGIIISKIDTIADLVSRMFGFEVFPKDIYLFDRIPAYISVWNTGIIAVCAVVISVVAAVYPAWKASILRPVEALRYE
ncbi:MAG: lipoprotein-releasing ABC transporter permease subunit [Candidatus Auribacterota bacterium]|jgi:lipoprotein-releasing system permease protein|nr:lipoprotein-releasing ABC transporter permease subunit [Candidatus Auribacterota bacterium]